jgi:hypothetical protein
MATTDELLSKMEIVIVGVDQVKDSVPMSTMLLDVLQRAGTWAGGAKKITITVMEPQKDGSIEYSMQVEYVGQGGMFICALRRTPMAETEYHS